MRNNNLSVRAPFKPNYAQLRSALNPAKLKVDFWPRGVGKSTGLALHMLHYVYEMPRSTVGLVGRSLVQLMTRTLPGTRAALEQLGYIEGYHYVFGKPHPMHNWIGPINAPFGDYDNVIAWHTGTIFILISQDRKGMARGLNLDGTIVDEAITIKELEYKEEIVPTIRANVRDYKSIFKSPLHHSQYFLSSKPVGFGGRWLLNYGSYYDEAGLNYTAKHDKLVKLQLAFIDEKSISEKHKIWKEFLELKRSIKYYTHFVDGLKNQSVCYTEATVFDNIANLRYEYVTNARRDLTLLMFLVEILNLSVQKLEDSFYSTFEAERLCYDDFNYNFLDQFNGSLNYAEISNNWRADNDLLINEPLHVACDYNASINCLVIGQIHFNGEMKMVNGIHVKRPGRIKDNAAKFLNYYNGYPKNEIYFYYNNTANAENASTGKTFAQEYMEIFQNAGWNVIEVYLGNAWSNMTTYNVCASLFKNDGTYPRISFNRTRCKNLITSIELAPVRQTEHGFKKDKRSEAQAMIPQEEATHFSEAFDTLIQGWFENVIKQRFPFISF